MALLNKISQVTVYLYGHLSSNHCSLLTSYFVCGVEEYITCGLYPPLVYVSFCLC